MWRVTPETPGFGHKRPNNPKIWGNFWPYFDFIGRRRVADKGRAGPAKRKQKQRMLNPNP